MKATKEELKFVIACLAHEIRELGIKCSPNQRGQFPREGAKEALNISVNMENILSIDPSELEKYGYKKLDHNYWLYK
ncbi:MAG: hypothetical protein IPI97_14535 [Nitrosomonas sp.]|nr:hypothetical protein [Nitrosomonas sp.]